MPPSAGLGIDVGTGADTWLIKQGDLLLGPVPFGKLVELLYAGEVHEDTPVAPFSRQPQYQPLKEYPRFLVHIAKSQAKLRVEAQSVEQGRQRRRGRIFRLALMTVLGVSLLLGGCRVAFWLAIHRPWEKQIRLPEPIITEELPQISLASARLADTELEYPEANARDTARPGNSTNNGNSGKRGGAGHHASAAHIPSARLGGNRPPASSGDGVRVVQEWDQEGINAVVRANKVNLHPCLSAESRRQPAGWQARVPIEFTIANDGRITRLWIDHPDFKSDGCELHQCMFAELRRWKFAAYQGEQANVSLVFHIQAR